MISLDLIRIDDGIQSRVALDRAVVAEYREAFLAGAEFPSVTLFFDGIDRWLADGFHRVAGAKAAGRTTICGTITTGSRRDAVLYSVGANFNHGLRRSNADKRRAIETMLSDAEWRLWSDNKIAQACGVSDKTVAVVRAIFGNSEDALTVRTVVRGGKSYPQNIAKIGKAPATPVPAATQASARLTAELTAAPPDSHGARADNANLRTLFTLPSIRESSSTALAVPVLPPRTAVTGDEEVDAVLWLQAVVNTGEKALIDKALEAAKRIKTPMKELGDRYANHIVRNGGHTIQAIFATMGFGELEGRAKRAIEKAARRHEALSRFGTVDALFGETPAEAACKEALDSLSQVEEKGGWHGFDETSADERFALHPALVLHTLADVLHVCEFSNALYSLRSAVDRDASDGWTEFREHEYHAFRMLARIPPRNTAEALAVLDHIEENNLMDRTETSAILRNLIRGPRE